MASVFAMNHIHTMFLVMCILFALVRSENSEDEVAERERYLRYTINRDTYRMRCTRRFTPGVCVEAVDSVWTFEFQLLNCTERLGCPQAHRTNRFDSYILCKQRCGTLVDIYMNILTSNNTKLFLRESKEVQGRREGQNLEATTLEPPEQYVDEWSGDESIKTLIMYPSVSKGADDEDRPMTIDDF